MGLNGSHRTRSRSDPAELCARRFDHKGGGLTRLGREHLFKRCGRFPSAGGRHDQASPDFVLFPVRTLRSTHIRNDCGRLKKWGFVRQGQSSASWILDEYRCPPNLLATSEERKRSIGRPTFRTRKNFGHALAKDGCAELIGGNLAWEEKTTPIKKPAAKR